ncbi:carotenoid oxygenase family protein [soil metagenome]
MQGNFGPVAEEVRSGPLEVIGAIPPELSGTYVRNGSNPAGGDSPHWFFGDGMVHGMRLAGGRAEWYANRYVRTTMYEASAGFGQGPPGGAANQSNVSALWHGGRLLTSGEVGLPYELRADDLATVGPYDFGGGLTTAFTAHPKIDPSTGRLHSFGYGFVAPFLTYHVIEPDGTLVHSEVVELPRSTMIHDFAITDRDVVFWDLPVVFDLEAAIRFIEDPSGGTFPYAWTPDVGARVGVMPLAGGATTIQWFDIEPCYVFHGVNAFRRGDEVGVDVCRLTSMFAAGELFGGEQSLRRWTLDTVTGVARDDVVEVDDPGELPTRDPRLVGREHRHAYLVGGRYNPHTVDFGGVIKHDYATGRRTRWEPGPTVHGGEWLFVPTTADPADDAGYLLGFVHDDATDVSELVVLDATDVAAGPVARVPTPQRVPYGFHGTWIPS